MSNCLLNYFLFILASQIALKLSSLLCIVSLVHIEDELSRIHRLYESFQLSVVRMARIRHLKVEWQILVVFVVPACQNDKDGGFFTIALIDAKRKAIEY